MNGILRWGSESARHWKSSNKKKGKSMIVGLENLSKELISWYENSTIKAINVVSVPYRGMEPLEGLLGKVAGDHRILYITGEPVADDSIEEFLMDRGIEYVTSEDSEAKTVILDFDGAFKIKDSYDLIIYDDLNTFPTHRKSEMQELLNHLYYKTNRIIAYSIEPVFRNVINLEIPLKRDRSFVTEPRFIDTKIDIKSSIPNSIYEYINFFFSDSRHVMIFVPDRSTMEGMIKYLVRINPVLKQHMHNVTELTDEEISLLLEKSAFSKILFTEKMSDFRGVPVNFEFIVANSGISRYDYRQFVFLCLRSGLYDDLNGEVILVAQTMSFDMDRTKVLTRDYNRVIWESDQLFL